MALLGRILIALVALLHLWFLVLEMFFFRRPLGLATFHMTQATADACGVLAMNQGLYNGFLSAGLVTALAAPSRLLARFTLSCIIVAGIYGAATLENVALFFIQSLPAALALLLSELAPERAQK